jgi:hypothetical protein
MIRYKISMVLVLELGHIMDTVYIISNHAEECLSFDPHEPVTMTQHHGGKSVIRVQK